MCVGLIDLANDAEERSKSCESHRCDGSRRSRTSHSTILAGAKIVAAFFAVLATKRRSNFLLACWATTNLGAVLLLVGGTVVAEVDVLAASTAVGLDAGILRLVHLLHFGALAVATIRVGHVRHAAVGDEHIEELLTLRLRCAHCFVKGHISGNGDHHGNIHRGRRPPVEALVEGGILGGEKTAGSRSRHQGLGACVRGALGAVSGGAIPKAHGDVVARRAAVASDLNPGVDGHGIGEFRRGRIEDVGLAEERAGLALHVHG